MDRGGFVHHKSYKKRAAINYYQFYEGCIPGGLGVNANGQREKNPSAPLLSLPPPTPSSQLLAPHGTAVLSLYRLSISVVTSFDKI